MITSVLAVAPLRVSFVGGGTDIESFFMNSEGSVVSCAINKYVFVHVKIHDDSFGERYRISYSEVEHVQEISEIKNEIVRNCLEFTKTKVPVQISTLSDLPAGTGLGSSSSFTVALLLALHALKGEHPTKDELAEQACHVEINLLGHPIGKQDQYAAAFGGLNFLRFKSDGRVLVEPIRILPNKLKEFSQRCKLLWTHTERSATKILIDQASRASLNLNHLLKMTSLSYEFRNVLEQSEIKWNQLSDLINTSWLLKQNLSPLIVSSNVEEIIKKVKLNEKFGVKLLGAGGGGFVLAFNGGNLLSSSSGLPANITSSSFVPQIDHLGARVISTF